ncbi:MAG: PQQ-binding-like beta-propeller repeat protein [Spirochaetales bacterium]|nr:PQQ-binding-like beta-propeller repeat protein [Spirochaetales bacterium]
MKFKRLLLTILLFFIIFYAAAESEQDQQLGLLWKYAVGGKLTGSPAVSKGGRVYLYAEDRYIHSIDSHGRFLWKFRLSGRPASSLAVSSDGSIYGCTESGLLYALNPAGEELWRFDAGGEPAGDPAVSASGTVYLCLVSGEVYAVSHTGRLRWKIETGEKIKQSPAVDSGTAIYIFTDHGGIFSLTPWGTENWRYLPEDSVSYELGLAVIHRNVLYRGRANYLEAVGSDGALLWLLELAEDCGAVMMYKNGLCVISISGTAYGYNTDGELLWVNDERRYRGYPVSSEQGIYLQSGAEGLSLLSFDGELRAETFIDGILSQPVLKNRMLIAGSEEWIIYAFSAAPPDCSIWSQRGGDASHGGRTNENRFVFNESLYHREIDYLYLKTMLESSSADDMEKALAEIGRSIDMKPENRGLSYILPLLYRAIGEDRIPGRQRGNIAMGSDFPAIRAGAADLIGRIGDFYSVEILTRVLEGEADTVVCEAIINALGELGTNYRNISLESVYNKNKGHSGRAGDYRVAAAAVRAVGLITDYSGNIDSEYGYRTLIEIYSGNYSKNIRESAKAALRGMR